MARIRTIKPEFFRHEALFEAEQASGLPLRVAYAGLFTAADREGRFKWSPRNLKLDCLPYDEVDFAAVLEALAAAGFIVRYEIGGESYGAIPSWSSHQHINMRERSSGIPGPDGASTCTHPPGPVPARGEGKGREEEGKESGASDADEVRSGSVQGSRSEGASERSSASTPAITPASTPASESPGSAEFDAFWALYPKRKGANPRTPAAKAFDAALRSGVAAGALLKAVKAFAAAEAAKIDTEFIPMAVTWLTQRRFDEHGPDPGLLERLRAQAPMMRTRGYELDEETMAWRKVG